MLYTYFRIILTYIICPSPYYHYILTQFFLFHLLQCLQLYPFRHIVLQNWRLNNFHLVYAEIRQHSFLHGCHQSLIFCDFFFLNYSRLVSSFGNSSLSFLSTRLYPLQLKHLKIHFPHLGQLRPQTNLQFVGLIV